RSPQDLGPPPQELALQSNRMSPLGIAMLYASDNAETALRETVSDSGTYVVGEFRTRRDAIILDLTQLLPVPSIFELATDQAAYTARRSRSFLHYIADAISLPIAKDHAVHVEYLPTQVVTEYVRGYQLVNNSMVDGIRYRSSVHPGHASIVLFATQENLCTAGKKQGLLAHNERWLQLCGYHEHRIGKEQIRNWKRQDVR